jgi:3-methyladenine DNA glycosylase AlkC
MPAEPKPSGPFKNWFSPALYRELAAQTRKLCRKFDEKVFLELTLNGLEERELMDRLRQTAIALEAGLPGAYREKLEVICALAPHIQHGFVTLSLCDFVARQGLDDFDRSMEALKFLTPFGSAELAIRPFILKDPSRALKTMLSWTRDSDAHVRRLASEGSRPRLPWGMRLGPVIANPDLTAPILEALKADPALYVRKSVANHLNDIAKDHPTWVLTRLKTWDCAHPATGWIARHGLRTLVKKGNAEALRFFGADVAVAKKIEIVEFAVTPRTVSLGDKITLTAKVGSKMNRAVTVVADYVIHYPRPSGSTSTKVFKWARFELKPGETHTIKKQQTIKDFTIRKHHRGAHDVELQINGARVAQTRFSLRSGQK